MPEVFIEMLLGEVAEKLPAVPPATGVEITVQEVSVVKESPAPSLVEVYGSPPDRHYQIGGTQPVDPAILVWYDITG